MIRETDKSTVVVKQPWWVSQPASSQSVKAKVVSTQRVRVLDLEGTV